MPESPIASVVIPVRNGADVLHLELAALAAQQTDYDFEVIIADNGSTDATRTVAESWADRLNLRVIEATGPASVSTGRNAGGLAAQGRYVMFCDADDEVEPGWVQAMVDGLSQYDIVSGKLQFGKVNTPDVVEWYGYTDSTGLPSALDYREYAMGGNMGIHTDRFAELGGFDDSYRGGQEEVDFCWRALEQGCTIGFAPDAVLNYRLRKSYKGLRRQFYRYGWNYAKLYASWRDRGIERNSLKAEIRYWLILAGQIPGLSTEAKRGRWVKNIAWGVGRIRGSIHFRVRCPL